MPLSLGPSSAQIQFPKSLPTKTSFGPDGKKQLSFPTNDLQRLFLSWNKNHAPLF
jgi:hypothetical protein